MKINNYKKIILFIIKMNENIYIINASNNIEDFYDEIENKLCQNKSGFGRNLDALVDILRCGFGNLYLHYKNKDKIKIYINKYKLLSNKLKKIIIEVIDENKTNDIHNYLEINLK